MYRFVAALALLIGSFCSTLLAAEKTVTDARLSQLVTVQCVNVRLHSVLGKLSETTKVEVRCGDSTDDWPVRDIPVLVCVKDVPLGRLLRAIADATHLTLTSSKVKGVNVYRIWRDTATEKELADYEAARKAAGTARAASDWDLWTEMDQIPDSEFQLKPPYFDQADVAAYKAIGGAVKELGPEVRQDVLAGNPISLGFRETSEDVRVKLCSAFKGLFEKIAEVRERQGDRADEPPTDLQLDRSSLMISFGSPLEYPDCLEIMAFVEGHGVISYGDRGSHSPARVFPKQRMANRPPRPEMPAPIRNEGLKRRYKPVGSSDAIARNKVKIDPWKSKQSPTYADAMAVMARESGLSIVATDFESYRMGFVESLKTELPGLFGSEVTVGKVLFHFNCGKSGFDCFSDESGKLLVCCDREWTERLKTMMPEKVLVDLKARLDGSGVQLDDLEPVGRLTYDQCHEWLYSRPEWTPVFRLASSLTRRGSLWPLYYLLSDSDRNKAKAGQKVRLANYDAERVADVLNRAAKSMRNLRLGDGSSLPREYLESAAVLSDPDVVRTLTLRLTSKSIGETGKRVYYLELDGEQQGKAIAKRDNLGPFSTYSPEREAELAKEKAKKRDSSR